MRVDSKSLTHVGLKRPLNEDSFCSNVEAGLYVVADGMGGHAAGEIASREAVDNVMAMVRRQRDALAAVQQGDRGPETMRRVLRVMESAIQAATYMVFAIAENEPEPEAPSYAARIVVPARTRSPSFARSFNPASRGSTSSVRDPSLIMPKISPRSSTSPGFNRQTMRRAMAPVICRTIIRR